MFGLSRCMTVGFMVAATLATNLAFATTYSNINDSTIGYYNIILYFGAPDSTSYGEVFNMSQASIVSDWKFQANSGNAGNMKLVFAGWNGSKAVGPALYSSSEFAYAGGSQALSFNAINTSLPAGSYIAYLTVAGVSSPVSNLVIAGSSSNGGLGGEFRFLNSSGNDPLTFNAAWSNYLVANMSYEANISPAPEPETYAMMLAGLGLVSAATRRGRNK